MFWVLLLFLAWLAAGVSCTRLCLAAVHAASLDADAARGHDLTLYEAAFLSGGPARVADLTLVSMARQRRLLLAHTGWATVVDPRGRDDMERSVIRAIGVEGQSRIASLRAATAAADSVRLPRTAWSRPASPSPTGPAPTSRVPSARSGPPRPRSSRWAWWPCCCRVRPRAATSRWPSGSCSRSS